MPTWFGASDRSDSSVSAAGEANAAGQSSSGASSTLKRRVLLLPVIAVLGNAALAQAVLGQGTSPNTSRGGAAQGPRGAPAADEEDEEEVEEEEEVEDMGPPPRNLSGEAGAVIARGTNTQPVGPLRLQSFRLEEIVLPQPAEAFVQGQRALVSRAYRLVITGGPFVVRNLPYVVWQDDVALGVGQESPDLSELAVVVADRAALREGAQLSVSPGFSPEGRSALPERLTLRIGP